MAEQLWAIRCPWGAVFATTERQAQDIADTYDRCCGCRRGTGPGPGSHRIERGAGHPVTSWKALAEVPRRLTEHCDGSRPPGTESRDLGICTMCEDAPATTTWGFPVCQPCADGLDETQRELKEAEAADPHLAELGRRVEGSAARFFAERDKTDAHREGLL